MLGDDREKVCKPYPVGFLAFPPITASQGGCKKFLQYYSIMKYDNGNKKPKKMLTWEDIEQITGKDTIQMAEWLGMPRPEYSRLRNGKPPNWVKRTIDLYSKLEEIGILPSQILLAEKTTPYKVEK